MFTGELMRCVECQFEQRSNARIESGWLKASLDGGQTVGYICPSCAGFPSPRCEQCNRFYHERYRECPWCCQGKGFGGIKP